MTAAFTQLTERVFADCDFEMSGPEGIVESIQISKESRAVDTQAVDCRWYIRAPPNSKVSSSKLRQKPGPTTQCVLPCYHTLGIMALKFVI